MKINIEKLKSWVSILIFITIIIVITFYSSQFFANVENIRNLLAKTGVLAPLVFVMVQIVQVVIAPISHYMIQIAGGVVFGFWLGGALNYVGSAIGSIIAFLLARKYGKPLVSKIVNKRIMDKYESAIQKMGPFGLFLIYFLPIFPDDEIIYFVGLSKMKFKDFLGATLFGRVGGMFGMAFVGATIAKPTKIGIIIILLLCVIGAVIFCFREKLERWFEKRKRIM
ncbi:MAG: VTT domain-containing protein [Candidatus Pacebacteria bacterium]|nr:VTT domain-containing protein [Candidatus Paceibacterota bacterium]